jgi:hypothetical protein
MWDLNQIIVDRLCSSEHVSIDIDFFSCQDSSHYLQTHSTMPIDISFRFYLMDEWINDECTLPDGIPRDCNNDILKVYAFNKEMRYQQESEL